MRKYVFLLVALMMSHCHQVRTIPIENGKTNAKTMVEGIKHRALMGANIRYSGTAKIKVTEVGNSSSIPELEFASVRPSYVSARGPFLVGGAPFLFFAMDGKRFQFQNVNKKPYVAYQGDVSQCQLQELVPELPISLLPSHWVDMLIGTAPLLESIKTQEVVWDPTYKKEGAFVLTLENDQGMMEKIWLSDEVGSHVLKVEWYDRAKKLPSWQIENKDFETIGENEAQFPRKTAFTDISKQKTVEIKWIERGLDINPTNFEQDFKLSPIEGTPFVERMCLWRAK